MRVLLTFALSLGFLPLLPAGELAWTDADTEIKPARHTIDSPDGAGCIRMLPVENIRSVEDANRERLTELTYEYGTPKFQDMGSGQPLPTLASLGIK